jgi:hypothetical protein
MGFLSPPVHQPVSAPRKPRLVQWPLPPAQAAAENTHHPRSSPCGLLPASPIHHMRSSKEESAALDSSFEFAWSGHSLVSRCDRLATQLAFPNRTAPITSMRRLETSQRLVP